MNEQENLTRHLRNYIEDQGEVNVQSKIDQRICEQLTQENDVAFIQEMEQKFGPLAGKRILEIGCGSGWRCVALARAGAVVTGIEPVPSGVNASIARAQLYPGLVVDFREGVAETLPFPENFFDIALSFQVIEHVQNVEMSLKETYRTLKKDGVVYMEIPNASYPMEGHYRMFWIPYMSKAIAKIYVTLRGKNPTYLDQLNFIYRRSILKMMRNIGYCEARDCYGEYIQEKFAHADAIRNPNLKRILLLFPKRMHGFFGKMIFLAGMYPCLRIMGKK
jgi:ubiquinone/menaquinone biosynthesis C-methylase UbiE